MDTDEICYHFAMTDGSRATLEDYLWRYPAAAVELVDLWFELQRPLDETVELESPEATDRALAQFRLRLAELEAERRAAN